MTNIMRKYLMLAIIKFFLRDREEFKKPLPPCTKKFGFRYLTKMEMSQY